MQYTTFIIDMIKRGKKIQQNHAQIQTKQNILNAINFDGKAKKNSTLKIPTRIPIL